MALLKFTNNPPVEDNQEPQKAPAEIIDLPNPEPISDDLLTLERQAVALVASYPDILPLLDSITFRDRKTAKMLDVVRDVVTKGTDEPAMELDALKLYPFADQIKATEELENVHQIPSQSLGVVISHIRRIQQKDDLEAIEDQVKYLKATPDDAFLLNSLLARIERFRNPADKPDTQVAAVWGQDKRPKTQEEAISRRPEVILDGLLYQRSKLIVGGVAKAGKSYFCMKMANALSRGETFLRWTSPKPRKVLYVDFELHEWELNERCAAVCNYDIPDTLGTISLRRHHTVRDPESLGRILHKEAPGCDVIILDCLYKFNSAEDENDNTAMKAIGAWMDGITKATGAAIILVHHFGKGSGAGRDSIDRFRGASSIVGEMDAILGVSKHEEEGFFIVETTARSFKPTEPFVAQWDFPHWRLAADKDATKAAKPGAAQAMPEDKLLLKIPNGKINAVCFEALGLDITRRTFDRRIAELPEVQKTRLPNNKTGFFKGGLYE